MWRQSVALSWCSQNLNILEDQKEVISDVIVFFPPVAGKLYEFLSKRMLINIIKWSSIIENIQRPSWQNKYNLERLGWVCLHQSSGEKQRLKLGLQWLFVGSHFLFCMLQWQPGFKTNYWNYLVSMFWKFPLDIYLVNWNTPFHLAD